RDTGRAGRGGRGRGRHRAADGGEPTARRRPVQHRSRPRTRARGAADGRDLPLVTLVSLVVPFANEVMFIIFTFFDRFVPSSNLLEGVSRCDESWWHSPARFSCPLSVPRLRRHRPRRRRAVRASVTRTTPTTATAATTSGTMTCGCATSRTAIC